MQILNFGSCNIDSVYAVDHILRPGETIAAESASSFPGGKGLNQTIALARAGAKVFHAGCIGADGEMLVDCMSRCGVDLRYLRTVDDKTGLAIIQVDKNAENAIVIYSGANARITRQHIDDVLSNFHPGDIMLAQNEISEVPYLIEQAAKKGLQVVFNPSPFNDRIKQVDPKHITYMLLNEVEAESFWGTCDPNEILPVLKKNYPNMKIVLTLGKRGSVFFDNGHYYKQSAFSVNAVDTTAAGDTFTGYFIACVAMGMDPKASMRYAAAASALTVSRKGASSSIPMMDEVEKELNRLKPYSSNSVNDTKNMVLSFFENHYQDGTLKMLAAELGYSTSYTSSWLRSNLGASFTELIQNKKCSVAAKYLEETVLSVTEIIQKVGYRNESFFRKMFQERYQCNPLKYRQRSVNGYGAEK